MLEAAIIFVLATTSTVPVAADRPDSRWSPQTVPEIVPRVWTERYARPATLARTYAAASSRFRGIALSGRIEIRLGPWWSRAGVKLYGRF